MTRSLSFCFLILGLIGAGHGVTSKLDFGEEEASTVTNSSRDDDDVEVKHTIVVSTRLKNNNRRGLHTNEEPSAFIHTIGNRNPKRDDSDEVPILKAYKSVDTTQIRTPDTRFKSTNYPEFVINRQPRDEYDLYPNMDSSSMHFKPSSLYNNINWWNQDNRNNGFRARNRPDYPKINRRVNDDGVREFYCRKCRELSGSKGCFPRNSWIIESTTPRIKIDGKIAKLN